MPDLQFIAVIYRRKKCPTCDELDDGYWSRIDCGCLFEVEIGRYATQNAARVAAMGASRAKGRGRFAGICTGDWHVESTDGVIEAGCTRQDSPVEKTQP